MPALLTRSAAAAEIGISTTTLDRWISRGEIPTVMIGGHRWVARSTVEALGRGELPAERPREQVRRGRSKPPGSATAALRAVGSTT